MGEPTVLLRPGWVPYHAQQTHPTLITARTPKHSACNICWRWTRRRAARISTLIEMRSRTACVLCNDPLVVEASGLIPKHPHRSAEDCGERDGGGEGEQDDVQTASDPLTCGWFAAHPFHF